MKTESFIPYHIPSVGDEEIAAVTEVLRSGWLTTGPKTAQFEREFAAYVHAPHALAVNSCTAGLHLALAALGIGPGDEVITTPLTFCATVNCILHTGATPVLADVDRDGNIDPQAIRKAITQRTRAIIPVHYGGLPCDLQEIWAIAKAHNLFVVEDAAHASGAVYHGSPIGGSSAGQMSDAVAFSFYATKNLTTGEGGMVTTHNPELMEKMRTLCLHGINKDAWNRYSEAGSWFYTVSAVGFKYNLSDLQSAIGIANLHKQEQFQKARTSIAGFYRRMFAGVDELETPVAGSNCRHAWHLYPIRLRLQDLDISRAQFIRELHARGIGTSVHFIPIPLHPAYASWPSLAQANCPVAMSLYERSVSLPIYPLLGDAELQRITGAVTEIIAAERKKDSMLAVCAS